MAEKLEDLNLPSAVVGRIIKSVLPDNVFVGKEAKSAVGTASSMFVLYLTSAAVNLAHKSNRKTLAPQDVYEALIELEFGNFIPQLKKVHEEFKTQKGKKGGAKNKQVEIEDVEMEPEVEDEETEGSNLADNDNEENEDETTDVEGEIEKDEENGYENEDDDVSIDDEESDT